MRRTGPWTWNLASLDPAFVSLASEARFIWEAPQPGTPFRSAGVVAPDRTGKASTRLQWTVTYGRHELAPVGPVIRNTYSGIGSTQRIRIENNRNQGELTGIRTDTEGTILLVFQHRNDAGSTQYHIGRSATDNIVRAIYTSPAGTQQILFKSSADLFRFTTDGWVHNDWYVMVLRGGPGGNDIFRNGQRLTPSYTAGSPATDGWFAAIADAQSWDWRLGFQDLGSAANQTNHTGGLALHAYWSRKLTNGEIAQLSRDPFGLTRLEDLTPILIPSAPGPITGAAVLLGAGTVTADGQTSATGAATLAGTGTLTADGTIGIPTGQAALTGTGILTADGTAIVPIVGEADLQGVGILTAQSLPPLSILTIRQLLAEGIRQSLHLAGRDDVAVYEYPPETVVIPAVVIMPDEPYWVPSNFGRSPLERIRVNLELQMLTPRLEVSESFNDLERLGGIVLQGTLRVPVVQWTELGQPEGVTVNDIETIMTRASVMAHV